MKSNVLSRRPLARSVNAEPGEGRTLKDLSEAMI